MIYQSLDTIQITTYPPLRYSDEYTFLPFKSNKQDIVFQTPRLFVPFGIQQNDNSKQYVMISFQNKENDPKTNQLLQQFQSMYDMVNSKYNKTYTVNPFLKTYGPQKETIMNMKVRDDALIFDMNKQCRDEFPIYSYASFIVHLSGLWISKQQIWFHWVILQSRLENNLQLTSYAFKDTKPIPPPPPPPPPPPTDKYKKMISVGIPKQAVHQQKKMDQTARINSQMLQSVKLKKPKSTVSTKIPNDTGFEPPSLDALQMALRKLRSIIEEQN